MPRSSHTMPRRPDSPHPGAARRPADGDSSPGRAVDKLKTQALQVAKEIVVKFIETGRISPANFAEHFGPIYREVLRTIDEPAVDAPARIIAPAASGAKEPR